MTVPNIHGRRRTFSASAAVDAQNAILTSIKTDDAATWADMGRVLGKSDDRAAAYANTSSPIDLPTFLAGCHGALRINSDADSYGHELILTEGPEDGLSLAQELGAEVWVTLGTAMMPFIDYPPRIVSIVIAGQNDAAGRAAVEQAEEDLFERGFATRTMWPADGFKDWNDQLRGIRA